MRVLHLHSGNIYGGIETMLAAFARERGTGSPVESSYALCFDGRLSTELARLGAQVTLLGGARLTRPGTVRRARAHAGRLLREVRPDVVIVHLPWSQIVFGREIRGSGARAVLWMHGPGGGWLQRWGARHRPDGVLCNSAFTRQTLPRYYRSLPVAVIHPALTLRTCHDPDARRRAREEAGATDGTVVVVQASRLEAWKGHEVHLRALARLANREWRLWIVGAATARDAPYARGLAALARSLGIADRVRFFGERDDVPRVLAAADIYCQPNLEPEPFGLAYVEALAAGLPVVASDAGGVREIVDAATGVLVPPGDDAALAAALEPLIGDPILRRRLGSAGPARASDLCDASRQLSRLAAFVTRLDAAAS